MVKIQTLMEEQKISKISDIEIERYTNFLEGSYKDNLNHSKFNLKPFPRWSIISGYYAMHDITKLFLAKKYRIKVEMEVHATTIKVLRELIKNKDILNLIEAGYKEFLTLANDLEEAKRERVKAQYYTGTKFMHEEYKRKSADFYKNIIFPYINKMAMMLK